MDELDKHISQYLDSTHSTTWGKSFDVIKEDTRAECIRFIRRTVIEVVTNGLARNETSDQATVTNVESDLLT